MLDGKDDPLDSVLWKSAKPDRARRGQVGQRLRRRAGPAGTSSARPWPAQLLGETFDIHGGGADLQFPHHENEIAQSEGANGKPLARIWMHNGFINIDDEKMSKSAGQLLHSSATC